MKKVLIILVILIAPLAAVAQDHTTSTTTEAIINVTTSSEETFKTDNSTKDTAEAKIKAEVNGMNYKKSNDIISIKAYRKSLQIKVKEVKLC